MWNILFVCQVVHPDRRSQTMSSPVSFLSPLILDSKSQGAGVRPVTTQKSTQELPAEAVLTMSPPRCPYTKLVFGRTDIRLIVIQNIFFIASLRYLNQLLRRAIYHITSFSIISCQIVGRQWYMRGKHSFECLLLLHKSNISYRHHCLFVFCHTIQLRQDCDKQK